MTKGISCVCGFHVYRDIYAVLGSVPPYVSAICGTLAIVCAPFSLLPYLDVLLHLTLLDSHELLLELVLRTKASLLGPVRRIYAAGTYCNRVILAALSCSRGRILLYNYMRTFIRW